MDCGTSGPVMRKAIVGKPWLLTCCLIGLIAAVLGAQFPVVALQQPDVLDAPRVSGAVQPPSAQAEPIPALKADYPAGSILNTAVLDVLPEAMSAAVMDSPRGGPT